MRYFERRGSALLWRNDGETLLIVPWGRDSLRVRSAMMREPEDTSFALLPPSEEAAPVITLGDSTASITNGRITAAVDMDGWRAYARVTYLNSRGGVLLRETPCGGALALKARHFKPLLGGDHALTVTFEAREGERLYGMGQYQQEFLDLKHCSLELAHRNSQASVPFLMSSLGYGFLWHNPAVGEAHFGKTAPPGARSPPGRWTTSSRPGIRRRTSA